MRMRVRVLFAQQQGLSHGCNCCWWMAHASSAAQQMTVAAYYVEHTLTPSHSHIPTHGNTIQAKKKQMRKKKSARTQSHSPEFTSATRVWHRQAVRGQCSSTSKRNSQVVLCILLTYLQQDQKDIVNVLLQLLAAWRLHFFIFFLRIFIFILILCFESCSSERKK